MISCRGTCRAGVGTGAGGRGERRRIRREGLRMNAEGIATARGEKFIGKVGVRETNKEESKRFSVSIKEQELGKQ